MRNWLSALTLAFVLTLCAAAAAAAQGLQSSPYAAPSLLRGNTLDEEPLRVFGLHESPGVRRDIPNLQAGYIYYGGKNRRVGHLTLDYILPMRLDKDSILLGLAHSEFQVFSRNSSSVPHDQVFIAVGGGYRTVLRQRVIVGVNGFYDLNRFADQWLSSGGAGLEIALLLYGQDALDVNCNWYGDLSDNEFVVNEFRDGPANFDLQVGYSHQLYNEGPDMRLYGTGYTFDDKTSVLGWQAGVEIKSADGVLALKGETAYDQVNESYYTVSASVNLGFRLENLLTGRNPIEMPERLFNSPRNFDRLTEKVRRNWLHTSHGVARTLKAIGNDREVLIVNSLGTKQRVYVKFLNNSKVNKCHHWGLNGQYTPSDFPGWSTSDTDCNLIFTDVGPGDSSPPLSFNKPANGNTTITISMGTSTGCAVTQAEITVHNYFENQWHDGYDISLVNGFNYKVTIDAPYPEVKDPYTPGNPIRCLPAIEAKSRLGNSTNVGVFGLGNDQCCASCAPPSACCTQWGDKIAGEAHPTYKNVAPNCPTTDPYAPCASTTPKPVNQGTQPCDPRPRCQMDGWHSQATGKKFTVTFDTPD